MVWYLLQDWQASLSKPNFNQTSKNTWLLHEKKVSSSPGGSKIGLPKPNAMHRAAALILGLTTKTANSGAAAFWELTRTTTKTWQIYLHSNICRALSQVESPGQSPPSSRTQCTALPRSMTSSVNSSLKSGSIRSWQDRNWGDKPRVPDLVNIQKPMENDHL